MWPLRLRSATDSGSVTNSAPTRLPRPVRRGRYFARQPLSCMTVWHHRIWSRRGPMLQSPNITAFESAEQGRNDQPKSRSAQIDVKADFIDLTAQFVVGAFPEKACRAQNPGTLRGRDVSNGCAADWFPGCAIRQTPKVGPF